ncbi:MAG: lysylphosphatidylglycerol synthase transmembrane domain-containing protein [Xanthobacteraceae bacterium]
MEPLLCSRPDISLVVDDAPIQSKWLRRSGLVLAATVSAYAGATLWAGHTGWHVALTSISPRDILIIVSLVSVGFLLRAGRWHYYTHILHWNVSLLHSLSAFVASIALTATPGKSGELAKAVLLRERYRISLSQGAGVLLIERVGDLFAVMALAVGGLTLFVDLSRYVFASVIVIAAAIFLALNCRVVLARAQAIPRLRNFSVKLADMLDAVWLLTRPIPMLVGAAIALAAWSCEALAFHHLLGKLGIHSSLLVSFSIYGLSTLAGALSMLPGGLGGVEAAMAFLLTRLAPPAGAATVAVVIFRLCTLWLFSLIGALFMFAWMVFLTKRRRSSTLIATRQ